MDADGANFGINILDTAGISRFTFAPARPSWVADARGLKMQAYPEILKTVGFVGCKSELGFCALGTCFFLFLREEELDFRYVVCCRHVVRKILHPLVRVNRKSRPPRDIPIEMDEWIDHEHPRVDISVAHFNIEKWDSDDELDICPIAMHTHEEARAQASLSIGDELFIPSLFVGRTGDMKNIPVLRVATLAAMDEEPVWAGSPNRPAYLVETRSLGGTSGSPVFLNVFPRRIVNRGATPIDQASGGYAMYYLLIGLFIGSHSGQYQDDFVADDDAPNVPKDVDFNAGIGIALPIAQVLEVLNQPVMKNARRATIEAKQKQSGYRPA